VSVRPTHLRLVLPFGISFFTFETMSYTIDVWRGQIEPAKRYLDYVLFVCFFPHLVAGPIVRPAQMLPQLARAPLADAALQARGLWRIATGLAKKILVGDFLAQAIVKRVFDAPERFTALEVVLATYAYAVQIHADFSGYSDIAIGSAALFGYELPENFDAPYLSHNLREFWGRWHITLSTWLRDGPWKTYRNLMLTMILGGLWHGASYNFLLWGALHGGALAATRMWQRSRGDRDAGALVRALQTVATFHFVCFAWIFFRAPTFAHAILALEQMGRGSWTMDHVTPEVALVVGFALLIHALPRAWEARTREAFVRTPALVQGLVLATAATALHLAAAAKPEPFVYGQF
jgi:D-alanyl-lipoteichoic acid acyltransferase DltB (MBOAT superfamily)